MKKKFIVLALATAYAIFFSLGIECLLSLLGIFMGISFDGPSVAEQYPRFTMFCAVAGLLALGALIAVFIVNLKTSESFGFTKKTWWTQMITAAVLSFLMVKPWELLFEFLQKTF